MSTSESDESAVERPTRSETTGEELMRHEIASMPLSKVRALKATLGVKLFDKAFFPEAAAKKDEEEAEDSGEDQPNDEAEHSRANRKRPRELSSRRPVAHNSLVVVKKKVRYDPRFECGDFDRFQFNRDYAFISDMRKQEVQRLKRAQREAQRAEPEKAAEIREAIRTLENQIRATDEQNAEFEAKSEVRAENIRRMNEGKRPIYLNNKQMKTKIMEKRFDKVKEQGNVKGYLKKRKERQLKRGKGAPVEE
ncbi:RRNA biogenesis protein RRP36 [Aphelenchoides fujianensis]|nr:RRNA biogenesis protein RRP36 [Aphelenchoides fujianensis]